MKIVLDTNVLVSGLLNPFGTPGEMVMMTAAGEMALCYDARIISEYREVFYRPKFSFEHQLIDYLLDQINGCGILVSARPLPQDLPDVHDNPFLEVALAGDADCLVTGNLKHYPVNRRCGMPIVSPGKFLEIYRKHKQIP